jgi:hypothetical protein
MGPDATGQITAALLNRWNAGSQEALVSRFYGEFEWESCSQYFRAMADISESISMMELLNPWQSQVVELVGFAGFARVPEGKE